jgi:hypothetical protein
MVRMFASFADRQLQVAAPALLKSTGDIACHAEEERSKSATACSISSAERTARAQTFEHDFLRRVSNFLDGWWFSPPRRKGPLNDGHVAVAES